MSDKETCPRCGGRGRYAAIGMFWGFRCDRCGYRAGNTDQAAAVANGGPADPGQTWGPVDPDPGLYAPTDPEPARLEDLEALALATGDPAVVLAYGRAKLAALQGQPPICWSCGAQVPDPEAETCPACGVDLVPF